MRFLCGAIKGELKLYENEHIIKWISYLVLKLKLKKKKLQAYIVDRLSTVPSQTTVTDRSKLKMTESMIWCERKKGRNSVDGVCWRDIITILRIWEENNIIDYACKLRYEEDKYIIQILLPICISECIRCTLYTSYAKFSWDFV